MNIVSNFFLSTAKMATIILVHVFLSTYTREFTWITYKELLSGISSLLIIAILISRAVDPACMLSSNVCGDRKILWIREWLPIPVFLLGECHTQRSLVGYSSHD